MTDRRGFLGWLGMLAGWQKQIKCSYMTTGTDTPCSIAPCKEGEERCPSCKVCQVPRRRTLGTNNLTIFEHDSVCSECGIVYVPREGK